MKVISVSAFLLGLLLVPLVRSVARQRGWVCHPRKDRWARQPVALCGGLGFFLAFLGAILLGDGLTAASVRVLLPAAAMCALGLADDFLHLTPYAKLIGQVAIASAAVHLCGTFKLLPLAAVNVLFSIFWIVAITNAMNLLDNMDGLSAGIGIICALFLGMVLWRSGRPDLAALAGTLAGGLAGFLIYNFPPASIFMGNCGSLFLGFMLAVLSMQASPVHVSLGALIVPALVLSVPLLDMTFVSLARILRGRSIAQGGRDHTSHRLVSLGLSERVSVLALYCLAFMSGAAGWALDQSSRGLKLTLFPAVVAGLSLFGVYLFDMTRLSPEDEARSSEGEPLATTLLFQFNFKRRIFEVCLDMVSIASCYAAAYLLRFDFSVPAANLERLTSSLPLVMGVSLLSLYFSGLYNGIWRFTGARDVTRFMSAVVIAMLVNVLAMVLVYRFEDIPRSVFPLFGLGLFLSICLTRYSFKLMNQAVLSLRGWAGDETRVLICGAGNGGERVLREILGQNRQWRWNPVGFIDPDGNKKKMRINGVPILGDLAELQEVFERHRFSQIVLSSDEISPDRLEMLKGFCRDRTIPIKQFRWICEDVAS